LIVHLLEEVVKACLDDISVKLLADVQLRDQVHVTVHLLTLSLLELLVVEKVHHRLRELAVIVVLG